MFPTLTAVTCECCGRTEVDDVALALIEEHVMAFRDALVGKRAEIDAAYAEAGDAMAQALAEDRRRRSE